MEFRPCENPITIKEKVAIVFFSTLFHRMITDDKLGINFYIPMTNLLINKRNASNENAYK